MRIKLLFLFIIFGGYLYPQQITVFDSVKAVINDTLSFPGTFPEIITNAKVGEYEAVLLDNSLNPIKKLNTVVTKITKTGGNELLNNYQFYVNHVFDTTGIFYIKAVRSAVNMDNVRKFSSPTYWWINVDYPHLVSPLKLQSGFYFGQSFSLCFAMREYIDISKYRYEIVNLANNEIIKSGPGSLIKLDDIINNKALIDSKLLIKPYYNNILIKNYYDNNDSLNSTGNWTFNIQKPQNLTVFHQWVEAGNEDPNVVLNIKAETKFNPRQFWFLYNSSLESNFITVTPEIANLNVTAEPGDFLNKVSYSIKGVFLVIEIIPNEQFLNKINSGQSELINLHIKFKSQFGPQEFNYAAYVF